MCVDCALQNVLQGGVQPSYRRFRHFSRWLPRRNAGLPEGFARVDVADAGDSALIQEKSLDRHRSAAYQLPKAFGREITRERFKTDLDSPRLFGAHKAHPSEAAHVREAQSRSVGEANRNVRIRVERFGGAVLHDEPPRHPEVDDQALAGIEAYDRKLPAPCDPLDRCAFDDPAQWQVARHLDDFRAQHLDARNLLPANCPIEAADDGLNFGKFGHSSTSTQGPRAKLHALKRAFGRDWAGAALAAVAAFVVMFAVTHGGRSTPYNNYVWLADAFTHGRPWIHFPGDYIDAVPFHGKAYIIEGPTCAILLMPFVAIWGTSVNQTMLSLVLGAIAVGATYMLGRRLGASIAATAWITAFGFFGTSLFWCSALGDVWFIAHVAMVCFTMLALVEIAGARRGWLVALWIIAAVESRFSLILAVPVLLYLLFYGGFAERPVRDDRAALQRRAIAFGSVAVVALGLWVWYNQARWGVPYDIGYTYFYHIMTNGVGSPFQLQYFPEEFHAFFVQAPTWVATFPYVHPQIWGIALPYTSPALVYAFFAQRPRHVVIALWVATIVVAAPNFVYYANGFAQFGMRHALDFEPFLLALMFLAARVRFPIWAAALCAYSVLAGIYGVYCYWFFEHRP